MMKIVRSTGMQKSVVERDDNATMQKAVKGTPQYEVWLAKFKARTPQQSRLPVIKKQPYKPSKASIEASQDMLEREANRHNPDYEPDDERVDDREKL